MFDVEAPAALRLPGASGPNHDDTRLRHGLQPRHESAEGSCVCGAGMLAEEEFSGENLAPSKMTKLNISHVHLCILGRCTLPPPGTLSERPHGLQGLNPPLAPSAFPVSLTEASFTGKNCDSFPLGWEAGGLAKLHTGRQWSIQGIVRETGGCTSEPHRYG